MPDDDNGKPRRPLSRSEKFKNYCLGVASLTALLLGVWANVKGEPKAQRTWDQSRSGINRTRDQLNKVSDQVYRLQLRVISLQAAQEGYNAGKLWAENQRMAEELEQLRRKSRPRAAPPPPPPAPTSPFSSKLHERAEKLEKLLKKAPPPPAPMPKMQQQLAE